MYVYLTSLAREVSHLRHEAVQKTGLNIIGAVPSPRLSCLPCTGKDGWIPGWRLVEHDNMIVAKT